MAEAGVLPFAGIALPVSQAVLPRYRGVSANTNSHSRKSLSYL